MEKTGQKFDMNPESLTLSHIFAMQLHRFQEKIGEVVNCAIKESANEKVKLLIFCMCLNGPHLFHLNHQLQKSFYLDNNF